MKVLPAYLVAAAFVLAACSGGGDGKSAQMTSSLVDPVTAPVSGLIGPKPPGDDTKGDGGAGGTFLCSDTAGIEAVLRGALVDGLGLKPRNAFGPVRVAITGRRVSPPLFESMELLGRERSLTRLRSAQEA